MRTLSMVSIAVGLVGAACAGKGAVSWDDEVKPIVEKSCAHCHDKQKIDAIITKTCAATLDDATPDFAAAKFPAEYAAKTATEADRMGLFAEMCADGQPMSEAKARVLYGLKALAELLAEDVPPDYTSQKAFEDFVTLGHEGSYEGCEMLEFLSEGNAGSASGMPPLWGAKLMMSIGEMYTGPSNADRDVVHKYTEYLLPMGSASCTGGRSGS